MNLHRPWPKLADCTWLARFVDQARAPLSDPLGPDFAPYLGHAPATDGTFLQPCNFILHLDLNEILPR
jgi:hypothetical protein